MGEPSVPRVDPFRSDRFLIGQAQAYLDSCTHRIDPPPELSQAWMRFYHFYDPLIRSFAARYGFTQEDLEDCVQGVWTQVFMALPKFTYDPERCRFRTWLFRLVHNRAVDLTRRSASHPAISLESVAEPLACGDDPSAALEHKEEQEMLEQARAALPQQVSALYYQVYQLREIQGWSIRKVAKHFGLPVSRPVHPPAGGCETGGFGETGEAPPPAGERSEPPRKSDSLAAKRRVMRLIGRAEARATWFRAAERCLGLVPCFASR
ncbi:MAG: sigma-70 family RNA polymerase sigma factor [Planctomycetes bacterium]|nr:sigma-70 family RNA polymerase sigma factor [Planctomycetota bacterium]